MPAVFEVELGTGSATANSLVDVAGMDQYFLDHQPPAAYTAATQAQKEEWARLGTQYICMKYGRRWKGFRSYGGQNLDWPRAAVLDTDGYGWSATTIPPRIKESVYEAVRRLAAGTSLFPDQLTPGAIIESEAKVGPLMKRTRWNSGGMSQMPYFPTITHLLRMFLRPANTAERS